MANHGEAVKTLKAANTAIAIDLNFYKAQKVRLENELLAVISEIKSSRERIEANDAAVQALYEAEKVTHV